jgi:hypothetical protein
LRSARYAPGHCSDRHRAQRCSGILRCVGAASFAATATAQLGYAAGGQDPDARAVPGMVTLPLRSRTKASLFWIILLLVSRRPDHAMIRLRETGDRAGSCDLATSGEVMPKYANGWPRPNRGRGHPAKMARHIGGIGARHLAMRIIAGSLLYTVVR